jgi:hypothetical protein
MTGNTNEPTHLARIDPRSGIFEALRELAVPRVRLALFGATTLNHALGLPDDSRAPAHALLTAINDPATLAEVFGPRDGFIATTQGQASLFAFQSETLIIYLSANPRGTVEWHASEIKEVQRSLRLRDHDSERRFAHIYPNPGELRLRANSPTSLEASRFLAAFCEKAMRASPKLRGACAALLPVIDARIQKDEIEKAIPEAIAAPARARL